MEQIGMCLGYVGVIISAVIYQQKSRKKLILWKTIADFVWTAHYLFIGAYTGAAVTIIAVMRGLFFLKYDRKSKAGVIALCFFLALSVTTSILTWGNIFSAFALAGSLTSIISFWIGEPKLTRILSYPISICMVTYGLSRGSWPALLNEVFVFSSSTIALLRKNGKEYPRANTK